MVKKDSYTWKIYGLVVVVLCIVPAFLHGQEKDFTTWASAGFKYKVNAARKSKVDDNTARMQSIKQLGV